MNKSKSHEEDSIYKIGNSTISEQEITTKKCKCGSTSHLRTSHRDCPMNKGKTGKYSFSLYVQLTKHSW